MFNPMNIMKIKGMWEKFQASHPKFPMFIRAVASEAIMEGSIIEINVTAPDGRKYSSNIKLNETDMELLKELKNIK